MGRYDDLLQAEKRPKPQETRPASSLLAPMESTPRQADHASPERANARTPERANGKRIITRNSFEIYEDLMDELRTLSIEEKSEGKLGSMSAMVRDALTAYLAERKMSK